MNEISTRTLALVSLSALVLGTGLGAAAFSVLDDGTTTVVKEVAVTTAEPTSSPSSDGSIAKVYDRASKAVVEIQATTSGGLGPAVEQAQGSGFVVDREGHVVTNQHVVADADSIRVSFWNGTEVSAELVGADPSTDVAVLKVDAPRSLLEPLALADSSKVSVGDPVLALGSPFGLEGTITSGIVSALNRRMTAPNDYTITGTIQTDAAINHGNSGGPLLDLQGRVVGVNAQIESDSGGSDGVGFAIPANTVRRISKQLIASGEAKHAFLGIIMTPVSGGVAVTEVRPGTPAEKAGLRAATQTKVVNGNEVPAGGDVIVAFDGKEVKGASDLQAAVDARKPGDTVRLTILRDGKTVTVEVTLAERP